MKFLFASIIGACIGYVTNWLAIKMLFRPYTEKRILGIKVPFTPGLIPKEKDRMAKSVGAAIGNHLLTKETMVKYLSDNGMNEKFKSWSQNKVIEIIQSGISIGEGIKNILGQKYEDFISFIKIKLTKLIILHIRKEKFKEEVENIVIDTLKKELSKNPNSILQSDFYKEIKQNLIEQANAYKNSEEFNIAIQKIIKNKLSEIENIDKNLEDVIPISFISTVKVYVYNKNYYIAMAIKDMLQDENGKQKIKEIITNAISTNISPMIAMFLNADTIYDKISEILGEYLDKEDNQREIALFINGIIDKLLKNKVSDVLSNVSEEGKKRNIKVLSDAIVNKIIGDKLINDLVCTLEDKIANNESIENILLAMNINSEKLIGNFVRNKIEYFIGSKEIEAKTEEYVDFYVDKIANIKIERISKENENKISKFVSDISENMFERFIDNNAGEVIEALEINKIVEEKINSFEVAFAEELIIEIASKELSAITWLGALLGSIIGLLSPILGSL
ncbi:DUF445 family protein [Clostridium aestuarii]|uniref:DUF445 family protein n=1 Tax=Clostridium aestuarii TaxID=338193 RepID=A0ABT4D3Y9_9CLOT|nr:DUF445 family protein [Clostridium aestuarii]MCY6484915.1 DUF445 family protein [Clostridium aestuarii]